MGPVKSSRAAGLALVAASLSLFAYRFANLDLVAFINDEPRFLAAARSQLDSGHWVSVSPLGGGTLGVSYGPTVVWFYGAVHWLFGPAPEAHIVAIGLMLTAAQLALAYTLATAFGGGVTAFGLVAALIASSPHHFFLSRVAWDPMACICSTWTVIVLAMPGPVGWRRALLVGLLLGFAASSHLMVLPFVALAFAVMAIDLWRTPAKLARTWSVALAGVLAVNVPYLLHLRAHPPVPTSSGSFTLAAFFSFLIEPARIATMWRMDYYFDHVWPEFVAWAGALGDVFRVGAVPMALMALLAALGLVVHVRSGESHRRRLALMGLAVWLGYAAFNASLSLYQHPHYQWPTWWIVAAGVAGAVPWLRARWPRVGLAAACVIGAISLANTAFIGAWMGYVRDRGGTPGIHYGTPLAEQRRLVESACGSPERTVFLDNQTAMFPHSLAYLVSIEPRCAGKQVQLCRATACPASSDSARVIVAKYARRFDGRLDIR